MKLRLNHILSTFLWVFLLILAGATPNVGFGSNVDSLLTAIQQAEQAQDPTTAARGYLSLGEEYFRMFEHEKALQVLQAGLEAARASQSRELEFRMLDIMGRTYFWMDDYKRSIEYHWQANELDKEGIPQEYIAENLSHIGEIYIILGNLRQALDYELQAREISEMILDTLGMAAAYDKIGHIYWQMGNYDGSLDYLKKALQIYQDAGQEIYIYQTQAAMSQVYKDMGRLDRAMMEAEASLEKAESYGYQYGIAFSKGMIGAIMEAGGQIDEAEPFLVEAINQFRLAGIRYELAEFSATLARLRRKQGNYRAAFVLLDSALNIAVDIQSLALKTLIYQEMAATHQAAGQFREAYEDLEAYQIRKDSLLDIDEMNQAAYLETDYELSKRERQIEALESESQFARTRFLVLAVSGSLVMVMLILLLVYMRYRNQARASELLRNKNHEINQQNEALTASNAELRRFSDLAATDLRLPVEGIREALEKLREEVPEIEDQPAEQNLLRHLGQLDVLLAGISAFAVVRQDEHDLQHIPLDEVVKEAIRSLPEQERKKATTIQMQNLPVVLGDRRQLVQLFQHLLSNAIRFQYGDEPSVKVSGVSSGKQVLVTVKDNGSGIPADDREKVFDLFYQGENASETSGSGVGLAVSRRIVRQHGGTIWVDPADTKGTSIKLTLPAGAAG